MCRATTLPTRCLDTCEASCTLLGASATCAQRARVAAVRAHPPFHEHEAQVPWEASGGGPPTCLQPCRGGGMARRHAGVASGGAWCGRQLPPRPPHACALSPTADLPQCRPVLLPPPPPSLPACWRTPWPLPHLAMQARACRKPWCACTRHVCGCPSPPAASNMPGSPPTGHLLPCNQARADGRSPCHLTGAAGRGEQGVVARHPPSSRTEIAGPLCTSCSTHSAPSAMVRAVAERGRSGACACALTRR